MHKKTSRALTRDVFSALLRQELHRPAAETFVHAVGDGEDGAPAGRMARRFQHVGLRLGVQIGGDLIRKQHGE